MPLQRESAHLTLPSLMQRLPAEANGMIIRLNVTCPYAVQYLAAILQPHRIAAP